jgi:hypothetical protein
MSVYVSYPGGDTYTENLTGEAAAVTRPLKFTPQRINVFNTTTNSIYFWRKPHGAAGATTFIDTGAGVSDIATITSNGITATDCSVTFGTSIQTTSDVVYWIAFK